MSAGIYEIGGGKFAMGYRHDLALAVVERVAGGTRPRYRGVRGRRPTITGAMKRVTATQTLRRELRRVAKFA